MCQPNSKRETNGSEKENEKKIQCQMQTRKEKNKKKENQSFRSKGANVRLEKKQYRADQETTQTEMSAETKDLSSGRSTNIDTEYRTYDKDKIDSNCDEAVDTKKCPAMKINKKAEDIKPNAYIDVSEAYINVFIEIHLCVMVFYVTFEKCTDFGTDVEQMHKESPAKRVRERDRTNRDKLEGSKTENTTYAAEGKIMNHVTRKETRYSEDRDNNDQLSSAGSATLYDLYKLFCLRTFLVEDLIKPNENGFGKTSFIHPLKFVSLKLPVNRPAYLPVFAIGFKGGSKIMHAFEDNQIIKRILQTHDRREMYLRDEHFRLATFSLSEFNYELGEIIRLAGSGFFCDADGSVKCFCCGNTYRSELLNSHHPDCASRTSDGHVGRSIADHYGEAVPGRLVPSRQSVQEEYRTRAFIDISIQMTTYRLGGTQQFVQDDILAQENELNNSANIFSVREIPMHSRQDTPHDADIDVSVSGTCSRNMGIQHENQSCVSSHGHKDLPSVEQAHVGQAMNTGRRTIKEDVNRRSYNDTARLVTENARIRARTLCCKCKINRSNIVFVPCGHLVVCNQCISNTTVCPVCGKKVDVAHRVGD